MFFLRFLCIDSNQRWSIKCPTYDFTHLLCLPQRRIAPGAALPALDLQKDATSTHIAREVHAWLAVVGDQSECPGLRQVNDRLSALFHLAHLRFRSAQVFLQFGDVA